MGALLSIQSHVVLGHVGNSAAVFALQRFGREAWPLRAVQFCGHAARRGLPALGALAAVRARHPEAAYACGPVTGDEGRGVYAREGVGEFFRDRALPEATLFPSRLATYRPSPETVADQPSASPRLGTRSIPDLCRAVKSATNTLIDQRAKTVQGPSGKPIKPLISRA